MKTHHVAILNRTNAMTDDQALTIVRSLQVQVSRDFASEWQIDATLRFVERQNLKDWKGYWNILLLDDSDVANALGYHDETPEGLPVSKCFIATDLKFGYIPSVTISHELLEMLLDPYVNDYSFDPSRTYFVAKEACDAVEADDLGYDISGVPVSDFVTPEFFDPSAASRPEEHFSFCKRVHRPFELAEGGYEILYIPGKGWTQNSKRKDGPRTADRPRVGSRRERRLNRGVWQRSIP